MTYMVGFSFSSLLLVLMTIRKMFVDYYKGGNDLYNINSSETNDNNIDFS